MNNLEQIQNLLRDINMVFNKISGDPKHVSRIYIDLLNAKIVKLYDYTIELTTESTVAKVIKEELLVQELIHEKPIEKIVEIEKPAEPIIVKPIIVEEIKEEIIIEPVKVIIPESVQIIAEEVVAPKLEEPIKVEIIPVPEPIVAEPAVTIQEVKKETVTKEEVYAKPEVSEHIPPIRSLQEDLITVAREQMQKKALNEKFTKAEPSINERIGNTSVSTQLGDSLQKGPISDIKSAITLNMKLSIIKDLFNGDQKEYKNLIDFLSKCRNYSEAKLFLQEEKQKHANWESKPDQYNYLLELINRRFRA